MTAKRAFPDHIELITYTAINIILYDGIFNFALITRHDNRMYVAPYYMQITISLFSLALSDILQFFRKRRNFLWKFFRERVFFLFSQPKKNSAMYHELTYVFM
jgi:hypothetical protein